MKIQQINRQYKNPKQVQCKELWRDNTTTEIVYGGAKNGGKSYIAADLLLESALLYPGTRYFMARNELNDLRKFLNHIPEVLTSSNVFIPCLPHKLSSNEATVDFITPGMSLIIWVTFRTGSWKKDIFLDSNLILLM